MASSRSTRRSPLAVMSLTAEAFGTVESTVHRDERRVGAVVRSCDKPRVFSCVSTVIYSFPRGEAWNDVSINERPSSDDQSDRGAGARRLLSCCCCCRRSPPGPRAPRLLPSLPPPLRPLTAAVAALVYSSLAPGCSSSAEVESTVPMFDPFSSSLSSLSTSRSKP